MSESFSTAPQQSVLPAYPYLQYSDDDNIQGFFAALNGLQQGYLDWFNQTPLGVYTSSGITGTLLDWCATGIYGISRPVLSTQNSTNTGAWNSYAWNTLPWDGAQITKSGTVTVASDDIYKRVLTWHLYRGDGNIPSVPWLRRRVARFIYGANGSDISVDALPNIQISQPSSHALTITIPTGIVSNLFALCVANGVLALPFQMTFTVTVA